MCRAVAAGRLGSAVTSLSPFYISLEVWSGSRELPGLNKALLIRTIFINFRSGHFYTTCLTLSVFEHDTLSLTEGRVGIRKTFFSPSVVIHPGSI